MIKEELYNRTVDILVQAYFKDELISNDCTACACGNLVMAANNYKLVSMPLCYYWMDENGDYRLPLWASVLSTPSRNFYGLREKKQWVALHHYEGEARKEILSTGYELHEFAKIENAFERGYRGWGDKMFKALMSVVDVLDEIHENKDREITKTIKQKFKKQILCSKI